MNKTLGEIQASREELIKGISREAAKMLKMLLEEKHIYLQVVVDAKSLINAWVTQVRADSLDGGAPELKWIEYKRELPAPGTAENARLASVVSPK